MNVYLALSHCCHGASASIVLLNFPVCFFFHENIKKSRCIGKIFQLFNGADFHPCTSMMCYCHRAQYRASKCMLCLTPLLSPVSMADAAPWSQAPSPQNLEMNLNLFPTGTASSTTNHSELVLKKTSQTKT